MNFPSAGHDPVMLREVIEMLDLRGGAVVVDCTLGRAGHAIEIARRVGPGGMLSGLDVDPKTLEFAKSRLDGAQCPARLFHANFAEIADVLKQIDVEQVDAIFADLGLSTNQFLE